MITFHGALRLHTCVLTLAILPFAALADDDKGDRPHRQGAEYKHEYRDGNCKVERKREKNGDFEEKIDCKSGYHGGYQGGYARSEFKEEFRDGNCKVKRELKKDGDYKEERKCRGDRRVYSNGPVYVLPQNAVVVEPGITIRGTVQVR